MNSERAKTLCDGPAAKKSFLKLRRRLRIGLLAAFFVPLAVLSAHFHFQFHYTMKTIGKQRLAAVAESQRNTVDLFLQERVANIIALFHDREFSLSPTKYQMMSLYQNLRQAGDAFIDLGFIDEDGIQIGYAGPYPHLQNKAYSDEKWYRHLLERTVHHHISDIYLGFRNKLHFTIAVKQIINGKPFIFKSTLDPDRFYLYLSTLSQEKGLQSSIVNESGEFQVVDPSKSKLMGKSIYMPPLDSASGAHESNVQGRDMLMAHAWLKETRWALMVMEPLAITYAQFFSVRRIMWISSAVIFVAAVALVLLITNGLFKTLCETEEQREEAHLRFLHATKLASLGELATGVAHEINNPLAIIMATTGVIRDMQNPEFRLDHSSEAVDAELKVIDDAVLRAKSITGQLLDYGRKHLPRLVPTNVNTLLDEVLGGFKAHGFSLAQISIEKSVDPGLPDIMADPDQLRQVFLNLINNAGDAIKGPGKITVATKMAEEHVAVSVTDTGMGIETDQMKKVFDPFFTTKEVGKGTGLGLSVSLGIVQSLGGTIDVQSMPGAGSTFTVRLPIIWQAEKEGDSDAASTQP